MIIGKKKGQQYGLIRPGQPQKPPLPKKKLSIFEEDADAPASTGVAGDIARQAAKKRTDTKTAEMHAAALAEDPSVFDYDGVFEDLQAKKEKPKAAEPAARRSRYIESLMDKAKDRQREQDIVYERRLAKERSAEDHLFGDKDRFVTSAYKNKLQEEQKWLAEEKLREAIEKRDDVVKRGHMGDFYRNLMHNNVAFGTAGTRPDQAAEEAAGQPEATDDPAAESAPVGNNESAARGPGLASGSAEPPAAGEAKPDASSRGPAGDGAAAAALEAYKAQKTTATAGQAAAGSLPEAHQPQPQPRAQQGNAGAEPGASAASSARPDALRVPPSASLPQAAGVEAVAADREGHGDQVTEEPPDRDTKAASARERYLARKRKVVD